MRKRDKQHMLALLHQLCVENTELEVRLETLKTRVAAQNNHLNSLRKLITENK